VLAVWAERTSADNPAFTNQGTVSATSWGTATPLPQIAKLAADLDWGLPLRLNANGDAVVGWTEWIRAPSSDFPRQTRLLRFTKGLGWSATAVDLRVSDGPLFGHIASSDLHLLDDGTAVFSELDPVPPVLTAQHRIYRQTGNDPPIELAPVAVSPAASVTAQGRISISVDGSGRGAGTRVDGSNLQSFSVDVGQPPFVSTPATLTPLSGGACTYGLTTTLYTRPSYVAAPNPRFFVQAFTTAGTAGGCALQLVAMDFTRSFIISPTAPDTFVLHPPVLGVDPAGNGIVVWQQWSNGGPLGETILPVWSQSPLAGAWSAPQVIGSNGTTIGIPDRNIPIRFALSRAGQGVAALAVLRDGTRYIATARYSVASGWTDWSLVASAPEFSVPNVAINASGDAFLIYAAQPCTRSEPPPAIAQCGDTQNIYVLKVPG
jgi:hypothetical protein